MKSGPASTNDAIASNDPSIVCGIVPGIPPGNMFDKNCVTSKNHEYINKFFNRTSFHSAS